MSASRCLIPCVRRPMTIAALLDNMLIAWSHLEQVTICAATGQPPPAAAAGSAAAS